MISRTHKAIAFASLVTAGTSLTPQSISSMTLLLALIANMAGAILPDIDQASNRLWDLLPGGNIIGKVLKHLFFGHRTLSHSLVGLYLIYRIVFWLLPQLLNSSFVDPYHIGWALMIGYISHLAADSFTEEGLPLLFPLKLKFGIPPIRSWRIKTGKWFEKLIVFPSVIIYTLGIVVAKWGILMTIIKSALKLI